MQRIRPSAVGSVTAACAYVNETIVVHESRGGGTTWEVGIVQRDQPDLLTGRLVERNDAPPTQCSEHLALVDSHASQQADRSTAGICPLDDARTSIDGADFLRCALHINCAVHLDHGALL